MTGLQYDADLQPLHTFGLPVRAATLCTLTDAAQLSEIASLPEYRAGPVLWLGGGSNVVFQGDYPGLVVRMATTGIRVTGRANGRVSVQAAAGESWDAFVRYTLARGWSGLENLSLIPGTVGAAPVQNIGAYGVEAGDRIVRVNCYDLQKHVPVSFSRDACRLAYRDSFFKQEGKGRYLILSVVFSLSEHFDAQTNYGDLAECAAEAAAGHPLTAEHVAEAVRRLRRAKLPDPAVNGNAGSFFKNPTVSADRAAVIAAADPGMSTYPQPGGRVKLPAGRMIDRCGLKGFSVGGAAVHDRQALVLVNRGNAVPGDVLQLARHVQDTVCRQYGIMLEPEPVFLP